MGRILHSIWMLLLSVAVVGQNLVPNPSFEDMEDCGLVFSELFCNQHWSAYLDLDFANTPDLGYEGALFFPPSTMDAFDGNQYLNIECSTGYVAVNHIFDFCRQ